jgi:hypothetical protein
MISVSTGTSPDNAVSELAPPHRAPLFLGVFLLPLAATGILLTAGFWMVPNLGVMSYGAHRHEAVLADRHRTHAAAAVEESDGEQTEFVPAEDFASELVAAERLPQQGLPATQLIVASNQDLPIDITQSARSARAPPA